MGCGSSSNQVNVNDPTNKQNQVAISNFEENQKEDPKSNQDFFRKIQKMKLPENPEVPLNALVLSKATLDCTLTQNYSNHR